MSTAGPKRDSDCLLWSAPGQPASVECPWWLLEEIHGVTQEGFRRLSRGGIEVGGVLFGWSSEESVRIHAWRPIPCEHVMGPALQLSNSDKQALEQLFEDAERDPQLKVLEPVGWFVSHPRQGLCLTESDIEIFDRFFPAGRQVTLVVHPQKMAPTRGVFFMRDNEGLLVRETPPTEFVLEGMRFLPSEPETPPEPRGANEQSAAAFPPAAAAPERMQRASPAFPSLETARPRHWLWASLAVLLAAGAYALTQQSDFLTRFLRLGDETLAMRVQDIGGHLRIEWNRENPSVRVAERGSLFVHDGRELPPFHLDHDMIARGSVTYARLTEDVLVRLVVHAKGRPPVQELARFVGPPVPKAEEPALPEARAAKEKLVAEAEQLREDLRKETLRARELERTVRRLQAQMPPETGNR